MVLWYQRMNRFVTLPTFVPYAQAFVRAKMTSLLILLTMVLLKAFNIVGRSCLINTIVCFLKVFIVSHALNYARVSQQERNT